MTAPPGSRVYGVPSVKLAWFASARRAGPVPRSVFWPVPNVDSGLVAFTRCPLSDPGVPRGEVFAVVDAAFAQRRKTLRAALARWAGGADAAERIVPPGWAQIYESAMRTGADATPGVSLRSVDLTAPGGMVGPGGAAGLRSMAAMLRAQQDP
jgi:16S rRNA A1518/A1519 N6-dimethyltransferase RsmA/KsgA/DIM1 with predicted DNA glycosylase/AP lyase activity